VPEVDYLDTSRRPDFADLPSGVHAAVARLVGSGVERAHPPVRSGFGGGFAGLVDLVDGRRVFVKAAGPTMPHLVRALGREALLLPHLADLRCPPRLLGGCAPDAADGWQVLVLEALDGTQPGGPWTDEDAEATHAACLEVASLPAGAVAAMPLTGLRDDLAGAEGAVTRLLGDIADGSRDWPPGHVRVTAGAAGELARLSAAVLEATGGDQLVHLDLRPDNLVRERDGRIRVVDWNQAARGAAWVDLVSLWPLQHHHGVDVGRLAASPLLRAVEAGSVDAFLAFLVGFMLRTVDAPTPPGCTDSLRAHALFLSDTTVRLLAARRGWQLRSPV
jgi:hypothetical protein